MPKAKKIVEPCEPLLAKEDVEIYSEKVLRSASKRLAVVEDLKKKTLKKEMPKIDEDEKVQKREVRRMFAKPGEKKRSAGRPKKRKKTAKNKGVKDTTIKCRIFSNGGTSLHTVKCRLFTGESTADLIRIVNDAKRNN